MARLHGRTGRLYADFSAAGGGSATPVAALKSWEINASSDRVDVTAMGDSNKQYLQGLPDAQGSFSGFYDDSSDTAYSAARDISSNAARKFYQYPSTNDTDKYWYGTAYFDVTITGDVAGAIETSGSWAAASDVTAVGIT